MLTTTELLVLAAVHRADEEAGGLATSELEPDEREALEALVQRALVELRIDDEEDLSTTARITARGVEALHDAGIRKPS